MIHLSNAPIFLAFLQKYFRLSKSKYHHGNFEDHFYIAGKCNCNQKDCATVLLKRRSSCRSKTVVEDEILAPKGIVYAHNNLESGYVEIECVSHSFPFRLEINKLFPKAGHIGNHRFSKKPARKKIDEKDKAQLKRYFSNKMSLYENIFYDRMDFRANEDTKLFQHVR